MKKKLCALIAAALLCVSLTACGPSNVNESVTGTFSFIQIKGYENLYYDPATRIVYFVSARGDGYHGYGFMSAYYADNGLPYHYDVPTNSLIKIGE